MSEQKLKPCPFCGGEAKVVRFYGPREKEVGCAIVCEDCLANFHQEESCCAEENIKAWNKRASDGVISIADCMEAMR